jgi:hypothetical protein
MNEIILEIVPNVVNDHKAPRPDSRGILKFFGGTRRSVSAFAEASADTRSAFIHGLTPVVFCEGG